MLPEHVSASAVVCLFISQGYFLSRNCIKEIHAALEFEKPLLLVAETDPQHGGAPLPELIAECPEELRSRIFDGERPIIPWLRIGEFQTESLRLLIEGILLATPRYEGRTDAVRLLVPGSKSDVLVTLPAAETLWLSAHNPGAIAVAKQLCASSLLVGANRLTMSMRKPEVIVQQEESRRRRAAIPASSRLRSRSRILVPEGSRSIRRSQESPLRRSSSALRRANKLWTSNGSLVEGSKSSSKRGAMTAPSPPASPPDNAPAPACLRSVVVEITPPAPAAKVPAPVPAAKPSAPSALLESVPEASCPPGFSGPAARASEACKSEADGSGAAFGRGSVSDRSTTRSSKSTGGSLRTKMSRLRSRMRVTSLMRRGGDGEVPPLMEEASEEKYWVDTPGRTMLLLLNSETFSGEMGEALVNEVSPATPHSRDHSWNSPRLLSAHLLF